jgi:hypothetical protein
VRLETAINRVTAVPMELRAAVGVYDPSAPTPMNVLGSFGGRRDVRRARDKLVAALTPGGYLLYGDFIGDSLTQRIHDSWPGRLVLFRPGKILGIFSAHPGLVQGTDGSYMRSRYAFSPSRCAAPARGNTPGISSPIQ